MCALCKLFLAAGEAGGEAGGPEGCQQAADRQQLQQQQRADQPSTAGHHRHQGNPHGNAIFYILKKRLRCATILNFLWAAQFLAKFINSMHNFGKTFCQMLIIRSSWKTIGPVLFSSACALPHKSSKRDSTVRIKQFSLQLLKVLLISIRSQVTCRC